MARPSANLLRLFFVLLVEIGDDVVFGSRTCIMFTTKDSFEKVILCAGSNVADNSVVFGGSILKCRVGLKFHDVTCQKVACGLDLQVGGEPTCLEKGVEGDLAGPLMASEVEEDKLQFSGDDSTLTPFGRTFYQRKAPYFVYRHVDDHYVYLRTCIARTLIATLHTLPFLGALHGTAAVLYGWTFEERNYTNTEIDYGFGMIYGVCLLWTNLRRVILWAAIELTAKWGLLGQRQDGRYTYDASSYGQRCV